MLPFAERVLQSRSHIFRQLSILLLAAANGVSATSYSTLGIPQGGSISIASSAGNLVLIMQGDGNLVLYENGIPLWDSGTAGQNCGSNQCHANFQGDGNLVVYNGSTPLWASNTSGNSGAQLVLSSQAPQMEIIGANQSVLWANSYTFSAGNLALPQGASVNLGSAVLIMQGDGNLVLYQGSTPLWNSGTSGQNCNPNQCHANFQSDGNFVVFNGSTPLWTSNTGGNLFAELTLSSQQPYVQVGGNLSITNTGSLGFNSFMQSDGPHVVYVDGNRHVSQMWYTTATGIWSHEDFTVNIGAPEAGAQTQLATFMLPDGPHFVYVDANQNVQQMWYAVSANTWSIENLSSAMSARAPAIGTGLSTFTGDGTAHIFYVDVNQHLEQMWWTGSQWLLQNLSSFVNGQSPSAASAITNFTMNTTLPHIVFIDSNQHIEQEVPGSPWVEQDLTTTAGAVPAGSGSALASWMQSDGPHIVYVDSNQSINQLWLNIASGVWHSQNLSGATGAPAAESHTPLNTFVGPDGAHIYYVSSSQLLAGR